MPNIILREPLDEFVEPESKIFLTQRGGKMFLDCMIKYYINIFMLMVYHVLIAVTLVNFIGCLTLYCRYDESPKSY